MDEGRCQTTGQNRILDMLVVKFILTILSQIICLYYSHEPVSHYITPTLFTYSAIHLSPINYVLALLFPAKLCLQVITCHHKNGLPKSKPHDFLQNCSQMLVITFF